MATDNIAENDTFEAFGRFVSEILGGLGNRSLEEALVEFRAFQEDRERVLEKLRLARIQSDRGESRELNDDLFWQRVDAELDARGKTE